HHGADDNASGTAAVLELAAALAAEFRVGQASRLSPFAPSQAEITRARKPENLRRGIIFALWSGEELGLIGSSYFAEHPAVALSNVVAFVNFDMVGRLRENKLIMQGVGSSPAWRRMLEKRNVEAGFNLVLQEDPCLPTEMTAIYPNQCHLVHFFAV